MDALALQRVQVHGQRRDQRFSFAGLHLGDFPAVQNVAANELHIEVAHVEDAPSHLAHRRERFHQQVVERGALRQLLLELDGLVRQFLVGEPLHGGLQVVDGGYDRPHGLDLPLVLGAEDLREYGVEHVGGLALVYQLEAPLEQSAAGVLSLP